MDTQLQVRATGRKVSLQMNQLRRLTFALLAIVVAVGCSDTLLAQPVLSVTPSSLNFGNVAANSMSPTQTIQISSNQPTGTSVVLSTNQSWIKLSTNVITVNTTASPVSVLVNTQNLAQGSYPGIISVGVSGQGSPQAAVSVSMTVISGSVLSANPSSLSFSAQQGSSVATPSSSTVQIVSTGPLLSYSISAQTLSGGNWLLLGANSGTSGDAGFSVFVNPSGLAAGAYSGNISVQSSSTSDSVQIPVSLTINANAVLSVSPAKPAPFLWQTGTPDPQGLQLNVTSSSGAITFAVAVSPQVAWLVPSAFSGSTPGSILLFPKPVEAALTAGSYTTSVIVTSGSNQVTVPITLIAATHPLIQLSTNTLNFSAPFGSIIPPQAQTVLVTSSNGSPQGFTFASTAAWLTATTTGTNFGASGSGTTSATLTIQTNPSGLPLGASTGTITITPTNGDTYTETITVTLTLTASSGLLAGPQSLLFSYQSGANPPGAQIVSVQSTGQPLLFTVTPTATATSNCPANWLSATSSSPTTPGTVSVTVSVTGMTTGLCSGKVTLTPSTGSPVVLNVTTAVSAANQPELVVSMPPGFGLETAPLGASAYSRSIALTSTNSTPVDFAASTTTPWLGFLGATSGNTPQNLTVAINPSVLGSPGTYTGSITISSATIPNFQFIVPVTLTVTSNVTVTVSPTSLTFSQAQGGPLPSSQTLTLTSAGGTASFTSSIQYSQGNGWLQITPASGPTSGSIQVNILANTLSQGQYTAQIVLSLVGASASSLTIPVTLTIGPAQTLTASPTSLNFSYQITGTAPASQKITLTSTGGPVTFNVGTTATPSGWLNTDIATGTTSGTPPTKTINVTVNPQGLTANTYNGSISITAPGVLANPIVIPVLLVVAAAPVPQPGSILNGSSYVSGAIAPGELISIFAAPGGIIGPSTPATFTINSSGGVDPILAGVRVLFSGNPGTPTYVSSNQINVTVPWEINGFLSTNVVVEFNGVQSAPIPIAVQAQAPGLFTANAQGTAQLSAINEDGTYNGPSGNGIQPAPQGSVISVYGTGGGQTTPPGTTGSITRIPSSPAGLLNITGATATIGGQPATVQFAGAAPGLVTGVFQMNIVVPTGVTGTNVALAISINGTPTTRVTTIAVQ
jgi:uncharacterized protein (TIGR03437 family)